jgi:prophage maintenance system killer protein
MRIQCRFESETIWLTQAQLASLFATERSVITKHISNIFKSGELAEKSNVQFLHIANSDKPVKIYSLDIILSVGYRVNSRRATQFRIWATKTLKDHLVKGYTINEKRLLEARDKFKELQEAISFLKEKSGHELLAGQELEILSLLENYSKTLTLLEQYDTEKLRMSNYGKSKYILSYEESRIITAELKKELAAKKEASNLFGQEYEEKFKGILGNIRQTFGGKELYPSLEEKAAHLLYFIIKDHPFADGNKRIGSFLFVYFLDKNAFLYKDTGEKKINDNALTALALLIAVSDPKEKDKLIKIVTNLLGTKSW